MVVGYKRVSAPDQADLWQLDGGETDKWFTDKAYPIDGSMKPFRARNLKMRIGMLIPLKLRLNLDGVRNPIPMKPKRDTHRQADPSDGCLGECLRVHDNDIGSVARSIVNERYDPAVVLR